MLAGDRAGRRDTSLEIYQSAGGSRHHPAPSAAGRGRADRQYVEIPGPLRSFGRMAAISRDFQPDDILPALARNVVTNGYQASHSNEALEQTEYLKLVHRYLSQARELEKLAGAGQGHQDRDLRIAADQRPAAHARLPHARRLRQ